MVLWFWSTFLIPSNTMTYIVPKGSTFYHYFREGTTLGPHGRQIKKCFLFVQNSTTFSCTHLPDMTLRFPTFLAWTSTETLKISILILEFSAIIISTPSLIKLRHFFWSFANTYLGAWLRFENCFAVVKVSLLFSLYTLCLYIRTHKVHGFYKIKSDLQPVSENWILGPFQYMFSNSSL